MSEITLESTTSADGTTIGYLRRGAGPALVITHGSVSASEQWLPATEHLAQHFTCYVHDRRGRGRSGDATAYDLSTEVADIAALMAVAGPGAHLLGHSYGALCALAYAEAHALDGGTLLLFEPPLAVDGPVAGAALAAYRDLVAAGDLEGAFEFALVNFVRACLPLPSRRSERRRSGTPASR
jgi:pimeloyl-ACP methyl ester carboxylesterase